MPTSPTSPYLTGRTTPGSSSSPTYGDDDPLGVETFATDRLPLSSAPEAYRDFQHKTDGVVKVVFDPR